MRILGIDTGGTFTDLVYFDGRRVSAHKELSTPDAPERAILNGIAALAIDFKGLHIVHGTTVATNALLENKGARTVFITNHGFKDLLSIGRQTRRELYNLTPEKRRSLFEPQLNLEIGGRVAPNGEVVQPLLPEELEQLTTKIRALDAEAVAVCLLFSFIDDRFERQVQARLADHFQVSISSEVLAEHREYERGMATWLNSYLSLVVQGYLSRLSKRVKAAKISVMQNHGLTLEAEVAARNAVRLLLSGPAGGLWGSLEIGKRVGHTRLLTFDMGGTSTDVSIIDNEFNLTSGAKIADLPIAVPTLDIHTIGAGGGSVAWIDEGGLLQVGPESAGASPGPACYGLGGTRATVTDSHVVLGRLPARCRLAGNLPLDYQAAVTAIAGLGQRIGLDVRDCAQGIVRIANEQMAQALRVMSIHRGHDPRHFTLMSFGGAGGLHVCDLAEALDIRFALVPAYAGVLSALGLLAAPPGKETSQSCIQLLDDCREKEIEEIFSRLEVKISRDLTTEIEKNFTFRQEIELRYQGQSTTLKLPWSDRQQVARTFHAKHAQRFGHALDMPVEVVNLRLTASGPSPILRFPYNLCQTPASPVEWVTPYQSSRQIPVYKRIDIGSSQVLTGPAIIIEKEATIYIAPHWHASLREQGSLLLERG